MVHEEVLETAIQKFYPELSSLDRVKIGIGTYATAYRVGKLVFKFTTDKDDALASARVKGLKLNHIVAVDRVFKIGVNAWLIVNEYVSYSLNEIEKYEFMEQKLDRIHSIVSKYIYFDNEGAELEDFSSTNLYEEIQQELVVFLKELIDNDFSNADIHLNNVRVGEDGKFKLFDLGHLTSRNNIRGVETVFEELV